MPISLLNPNENYSGWIVNSPETIPFFDIHFKELEKSNWSEELNNFFFKEPDPVQGYLYRENNSLTYTSMITESFVNKMTFIAWGFLPFTIMLPVLLAFLAPTIISILGIFVLGINCIFVIIANSLARGFYELHRDTHV